MSQSIRYLAARALAAELAKIPALVGKVRALDADPDDDAVYPMVVVRPRPLELETSQAEEVDAPDFDSQIVSLGRWSGRFEVRVYAATAAKREEFGEIVLAAFLAREGAPGTLVVELDALTVNGTPTTYRPGASFDLGNSDWREEMVFSGKRFDFLEVDVSLPVLARRTAYRLETLVLSLAADPLVNLGVTAEEDPIVAESVSVSEEGDATPYEEP